MAAVSPAQPVRKQKPTLHWTTGEPQYNTKQATKQGLRAVDVNLSDLAMDVNALAGLMIALLHATLMSAKPCL